MESDREHLLSVPRAAAIAVAALAAGAAVVAIELASDHRDARVVWAVFAPAVIWSFVGTGLYAWRARPESRVGLLMVLLGFAWVLFTLDAANAAGSTRSGSSPAACGAASSCTWGWASPRAGS